MLLTNKGYTDEMLMDRVGIIQGKEEARLIALVGGPAREDCARWILQLLEDGYLGNP
ncbi:MAG: hypothetical protein LBC51_01655 [Treponema sp.]|nr:hypothetical protein [Treponema sp.]